MLLELGVAAMTRVAPTVWVAHIAPGVWLHSTTAVIDGGAVFPANGLIVERRGGALLIDTGYMPAQTEILLHWSRQNLAAGISESISTHFHYDRTGGVPALRRGGVRTWAHPATCRLAAAHGLPVPAPIAGFTAAVYRFDAECELFFPGAGHTRDNIVVWLERPRILFGGCFLKSVTSAGLGNVQDAVVADWAASVRRVRERYGARAVTVPGHGTISGDPVARTLALLPA
jgi:glyoxylase-like metal-dependent hydrolase (beta-lactamase superfamily II)